MKDEHVYVYILKFRDKTFYTGITNNLERRIFEHKKGYSKATKYRGVFTLAYFTKLYNRPEARKKEVYIKKKGALKFLLTKLC